MMNVHIADDQEYCLEALQLLLEDAADICITGIARNGEELVALLQTSIPDVIITDISMHPMDGITATRIIKKELEQVKVLGFTQYSDERLLLQMMQAGADGYLYKNTDSLTLAEAVRTVMDKGHFFCTKTLGKLAALLRQGVFPLSPEVVAPHFFMGKEKEVLLLLCRGLGGKQIADALGITEHTVNSYRANLRKKTGCQNDAMLVVYALQHGLFTP